MKIEPSSPPGRPNRKLRAHLDVLRDLHERGYSIGAICSTFCNSGIAVGWSTVQREVSKLARASKPVPHVAPGAKRPEVDPLLASKVNSPPINAEQAQVDTATTPKLLGPDGVDAFFKAQAAQDPMLLRFAKKNKPP